MMRKKHENKKHPTFSSYLFLSHVFDHKVPLNKLLEETNQKVMFKVFPRYKSSLHILLHFEAPKIQQPSWLVNLPPPKVPPGPEIKAL